MTTKQKIGLGAALLVLLVVGFFVWRRRKVAASTSTATSAALGGNSFLGSNILQLSRASLPISLPVGGPFG